MHDVLQTKPRYPEYLPQRFRKLVIGRCRQPGGERRQHVVLRTAFDREEKRKSELLAICLIELMQPLELVDREAVEAGARLLTG